MVRLPILGSRAVELFRPRPNLPKFIGHAHLTFRAAVGLDTNKSKVQNLYMKTQTIFHFACLVALTASLLGVAGCASTGHQKSEATAGGLQNAADRIAHAQTTRQATLAALNDLVENPQPDLRTQFKKFTASLKTWASQVQDVESKSANMQAKGAAYFEKWDQELARIQNEDIRKRSLARKEAVAKQFDRIRMAYAEVDQMRRPLMFDLTDIQTVLSADLTRAGLDAVKPVVKKANKDAEPLGKAVDKLVEEFKSLGIAMSAVTPQPEK